MASYKNVNSDYTLTCDSGNGTFYINAQTVFNGNVIYTVPAITDYAFLTVAANNTGAITDGGLLMKTNSSNYAGFRFDTTANAWQTSPNVYANGEPITAYANVGSTPGGDNTQVQFNNNGVFAGVANLAYNIPTSQFIINGSQRFGNIRSIPANVANSVIMYSNSVGQGGTGLYFTSAAARDELVSRRNAIIYGIIF
jgi:hypothetical protein